MQNLNSAADALNQVAQRAGAFWDQADAQIAQRQAAYDTLTQNLKGAVKDQLYYFATWDPNAADADNARGGTFTDLQELVNAAGACSYLSVQLVAGQSYSFDENIIVPQNMTLLIQGHEANKPALNVASHHYVEASSSTPLNELRHFIVTSGAQIMFRHLTINIAGKQVAGDGWSAANALVFASLHGTPNVSVGLDGCQITGADSVAIATPYIANIVQLAAYNCTVDGSMTLIADITGRGVGISALNAVTFTNGASAHGAQALGQNSLKG
jgi:hypothetical protein